MDEVRCKLLLVMDAEIFKGLISIGDAQRAIIHNVPMDTPISQVIRTDIVECKDDDTDEFIQSEMVRCRAVFMPVLDHERKISRVVFWDDVFSDQVSVRMQGERCKSLEMPVVIMAGGKGTRLQPLTHILPKPLLPLGKKTILENIMDRFVNAGCKEFYLSLNYKATMIRHYFDELKNPDYQVHFFEEDEPLGTAGSLSLIRDQLSTPFFVSNCDITIDQDLHEVWDYHVRNKNELTIVAALKHVKLAYGALETGDDGLLKGLSEKPELVFKVNSGVYILEPHLLKEIPDHSFYNMTDLIDAIINRAGRVGVFPVSENSWSDIGNWDDYQRFLGR
ncbi:MAG: nucleotidyltransferase family protein [Kiritimatiellae bacterium]|nr:nucleotidyltransferase family protein [Kiritimatiellia bacterium]